MQINDWSKVYSVVTISGNDCTLNLQTFSKILVLLQIVSSCNLKPKFKAFESFPTNIQFCGAANTCMFIININKCKRIRDLF